MKLYSKKNIEIKLKIIDNLKAGDSFIQLQSVKEQRLNMNAELIIKFSSTVMPGKRKLCECHSRIFITFGIFIINKSKKIN